MADYYRVNKHGSIMLITEDRIVFETENHLHIKQLYDNGVTRLDKRKSGFFTSLDEAKQHSISIINKEIDRLQESIESRKLYIDRVNALTLKELQEATGQAILSPD